MNKVCGTLMCLLLLGCAPHQADNNDSVRIRFVPGLAPSSSFDSFIGPRWTSLAPFPKPDSDMLAVTASAGVGEKFPVQKVGGPKLFEVLLKNGDDDRVSLEIHSDKGSKTLDLKRDESAELEVGGASYKFSYPSVFVAATTEKTATNKPMLVGSTPRPTAAPNDGSAGKH